jgi:NADPH-dependent 2,4-dienoyl-CoA reductase/sulfur reductase-like enzyme
VKPETQLAAASGLITAPTIPGGQTQAIKVNSHMQTSDPDIYAVGDAVLVQDALFPARGSWTPLAGPANRQARLAVDHIFLQSNKVLAPEPYRGSLNTAIVRVFDTVAAVTGWTEKALLASGSRNFESATVVGHNHASYYPQATNVTVKVLWERDTGRVLGGQITGVDGVDKRIDARYLFSAFY